VIGANAIFIGAVAETVRGYLIAGPAYYRAFENVLEGKRPETRVEL